MDAPPIPRLVDLVHVFKGVVVEQFKKEIKKRLEKLLSDSILLWRLLKLLFQNSTRTHIMKQKTMDLKCKVQQNQLEILKSHLFLSVYL